MDETAKATWTLALMSPVIVNLMSGSSPPLEFFNPRVFACLLSFLVVIGLLSELIGNAGMSVVAVLGTLFVVDLVKWPSGKKRFTFLRRMPQPV